MLVAQNNIELKQKLRELINPFYTEINNFERYLIIYGLLEKIHKDPNLRKITEKIKIRNQAKQKSITNNDGLFLYLKKELKSDKGLHDSVNACFEALNFVYQSILEMKKVNEKDGEKIEDKLNQVILLHKNEEVLENSLKVFSNTLFDALDKERLMINQNETKTKEIKRTYFDEDKSTLFFVSSGTLIVPLLVLYLYVFCLAFSIVLFIVLIMSLLLYI